MKRMNYLINGFAALAFLFLFSQCAGKADNAAAPAASGNANATSGLKIAYVEVDTLLSQYNFCKDLNADMISKEENSRMVLNQKANELRKSQQEFQKKYESNAFISPERAQQEYARLGNWNRICRLCRTNWLQRWHRRMLKTVRFCVTLLTLF